MNNANQQNNKSADLIIINGHVATQDKSRSFVSAIAIKNGFFIATGTDKEILDYKNDKTKIIAKKFGAKILNDLRVTRSRGSGPPSARISMTRFPARRASARRSE